jgi:hypothetical protein
MGGIVRGQVAVMRGTPASRQAAVGLSVLLLAGAIYALRLNHIAGQMVDDAWYILLARSLAEGTGYRLISSALEAILPLYPPGHPAVMALVFRVMPDFPENIWLLKSVSIAAMMGVGALTYAYMRARHVSRELAIIAASATIMVPAFVFLATSTLMSECLFTLVQLAVVVLIHRSTSAPAGRESLQLAALAGVAAGSAVLIRSAAVGLVAASALWLCKDRRWHRAAVFGAAVVFSLGPWLLYARAHAPTPEQRAAHGGAVVFSYFDQLSMRWAGTPAMGRITAADIPARLLTNAADVTLRGMSGIFVPALLRGPNESGEEVIALGGVVGLLPGSMGVAAATQAISFIFTGIVMVGFVSAVRRGATVAEFLVLLSLAIILLWPFWSFRFLLPLTPFLFFYLITGLTVLTRSHRAPRLVLLCLLGLNVYDHAGYVMLARTQSGANLSEWTGSMDEVDDALTWIDRHLPQDGMIASTNPALLYLRTNRRSIALDDPTLTLEAWRARGVRFLVCLLPSDMPAGDPGQYVVLYQSPSRRWVIDLQTR